MNAADIEKEIEELAEKVKRGEKIEMDSDQILLKLIMLIGKKAEERINAIEQRLATIEMQLADEAVDLGGKGN